MSPPPASTPMVRTRPRAHQAALLLGLFACAVGAADVALAQASIFDRIRDRASERAESKTQARANQEVDKTVDKTMDCVLSPAECAKRDQLAAGGEAGTTSKPAANADAMQWYAESQGKRIGPMPQAEIARRIASGEIKSPTLVWRTGMSGWTPAGQVAELGDAFKKLPPPLPPPSADPPPLPSPR
jgi:hypothetical protein